MNIKISDNLIKYISCFLFVCVCSGIIYDWCIVSNAYHIGGTWRTHAKDIKYNKEYKILCATLLDKRGGESRKCIELKKTKMFTSLENINGKFYFTNSLPKGNWIDTAKDIKIYPDGMFCAFLKTDDYRMIDDEKDYIYNESCITYNPNNKDHLNSYYVNDNGLFYKMTKKEYIVYTYENQ